MGVKSIQSSELEPLARRIWYAGAPKAWWFSNHEKHASFEAMGFADCDVEFPMPSEKWTLAGDYEISISYPLGEIPGVLRVRRSSLYRIGARVQSHGRKPLRIIDRRITHEEFQFVQYCVKDENDGDEWWVEGYEIEPCHQGPKRPSNKCRVRIDGSTYYVPWTSEADPTNPYRWWNREDVLDALRHISARRGTTVLSWSVAEQLARFYDGTVSSNYQDIAQWWKDHFRAEVKPYTYCRPFNLYVLIGSSPGKREE